MASSSDKDCGAAAATGGVAVDHHQVSGNHVPWVMKNVYVVRSDNGPDPDTIVVFSKKEYPFSFFNEYGEYPELAKQEDYVLVFNNGKICLFILGKNKYTYKFIINLVDHSGKPYYSSVNQMSHSNVNYSLFAMLKHAGLNDYAVKGSPFMENLLHACNHVVSTMEESSPDSKGVHTPVRMPRKAVPSPVRIPRKNVPTISTDMSKYIQKGEEKLSVEKLEKAVEKQQLKVDVAIADANEAEEHAAEEMRVQELLTKLALLRKQQEDAEDRRVRALGTGNSFAAKASASSEAFPSLSSALVGKTPLDQPLATRVAKKKGGGSNAFAALPADDDDDSGAEK